MCARVLRATVHVSQKEQMQKEMSIDTLPPAIAYEPRSVVEGRTRRSQSVQSNHSADTLDTEIDPEIIINDLEVQDSPSMPLRKKFVF